MVEPPPMGDFQFTPLQLLTVHLLSIIDIVSGQVFVDALPLIGGEEAKEELASWKIGVETGNDDVFREKKSLSTYTTLALGAFGAGKTAQQHIAKSQADSVKAILTVSQLYDSYRDMLFEFKKTLKSKDLTALEKLETLWAVTDALYESMKDSITENAKNDTQSLEKVIGDLNHVFISLEKLTGGAKMVGILNENNNNSSNI